MLGNLLVAQVETLCESLANGRKSSFDPRPVVKVLELTSQAKMRQQRNIKSFLNSSKYKNLMCQLQKEFDIALTK
jgi:hypothetical protein